MALTSASRLEHLERLVRTLLHEEHVVHEAWIGLDESEYFVSILVASEDETAENRIRSIYGTLLDQFGEYPLDLYVTNRCRVREREWKGALPETSRRVDL